MDKEDIIVTVRSKIGSIPYDLVAVLMLTIAVGGILYSPQFAEGPVRAALALAFLLFLPGYVVVAVLFPEGRNEEVSPAVGRDWGHIDLAERIVLSFASSVALVIMTGFIIGITSGINEESVFTSLGSITVIGALIAIIRRQQVPPDERFELGPDMRGISQNLFGGTTAGQKLLNGVFVFCILLAILSLSYGHGPLAYQQDEGLTEFYLLPDGVGDELAPSDYTTSMEAGDETQFTTVVHNDEGEPVTYTMFVLLQQTDGENGSVIRSEQLHQEQVRLEQNETRRISHGVTPTLEGENLRLAYLLYREEPSEPTAEDAYREIHLWVDVTEPGS